MCFDFNGWFLFILKQDKDVFNWFKNSEIIKSVFIFFYFF